MITIKQDKISDLLKTCKRTLSNIEKSFDEELEEIGQNPLLLKKGDPIQYEVGKNEFERETKYRIEQELKDIDYRGKDKDMLNMIDEIENYLSM